MKVLIIGASRGIGSQLLDQALTAGHQVTVLARFPDKVVQAGDTLNVIHGDILDAGTVSSVIRGQDCVCLTIGIPITFKPVTVFSKGTLNVIKAMQEHQVNRLVCVTGIGAGSSKGHGGFLYDRIFQPLLLKTIYADKDRQESYVMDSDLQWTIVRPAGLTNGPRTNNYRVINDMTGVVAKRISRADVADFILQLISQESHIRQAPLLTY